MGRKRLSNTVTLSARGRLAIPQQLRKALGLRPGDKISFILEPGRLILQRYEPGRAKLIVKRGQKVLVAPPGAPPMTPETVKALLSDFP